MTIKRSPFFYVGDKYKLMPQLKNLFPQQIDTYYEPFCGGGSSFVNTVAKSYVVNDVNEYVIRLHKFFQQNANDEQNFIENLYAIISRYELSCSFIGRCVPNELKQEFVKTYYAKYNKQAYHLLRQDYNKNQGDMALLYLLLIYGFNHMIRFNSKGEFNLPVGNVDFNANVYNAIHGYMDFLRTQKITFACEDFQTFIRKNEYKNNDFVFCDPPYLISQSEYNKLWDEGHEILLYQELDSLNERGIKFGLTNLLHHKGKTNEILLQWMSKYNIHQINSNYISYNDNSIKPNSREVFVTNG